MRLAKKRFRRQTSKSKKHCRFCANAENAVGINYKNSAFLRGFLTERGKILPSRISGTPTARHQAVRPQRTSRRKYVSGEPTNSRSPRYEI